MSSFSPPVANIFLAFGLDSVYFPSQSYIILGVFVGIYVVAHAILQVRPSRDASFPDDFHQRDVVMFYLQAQVLPNNQVESTVTFGQGKTKDAKVSTFSNKLLLIGVRYNAMKYLQCSCLNGCL